MPPQQSPGLYREEIFQRPPRPFFTGVPAFLGVGGPASRVPPNEPRGFGTFSEFAESFGETEGPLSVSVRGFFENGGTRCSVLRLADASLGALEAGLEVLAAYDECDLVCAPDVTRDDGRDLAELRIGVLAKQNAVLAHCDSTGDRFAILDPLPRASTDEVVAQRADLAGSNGALYYPWIRVDATGPATPPCGHVAGVYARSDDRVGFHKAPANEVLRGVLALGGGELDEAARGELNARGVNCLRSFPGRGVCVWGARTVSRESAWTYVNVRRLFLTVARWVDRNLADAVFEPNDRRLWTRIERELTAFFEELHRRGALRGDSPEEAFYVKCDAETNPPAQRENGELVAEIGLAPGIPSEFVVVRIVRGTSGTTISEPVPAGSPT